MLGAIFVSDSIFKIDQDVSLAKLENKMVHWFDLGVDILSTIEAADVSLETDFWVQYIGFANQRAWSGDKLGKLHVKGQRLARDWNTLQARVIN